MLQVSDPALQVLKDTLDSTKTAEEQVLRIEAHDNEIVLGIGEQQDGDVSFEASGAVVLAASEEIAGLLDNATIDVETVDGESRLFIAS